jgi:hypothetical protein
MQTAQPQTSHWLPIEFIPSPTGLSIRWIQARPKEFSDPFFDQTVCRMRTSTPPSCERITGVGPFLNLGRSIGKIPPVGFIFHLSRCGSTLLANAARESKDTVVLSEATLINSILPLPLPPADRRALLSHAVRFFAKGPIENPHRLIVKFSSWNLLYIWDVLATWPGTPYVILIRDPAEILVSLLANPPGWSQYRDVAIWNRTLQGLERHETWPLPAEDYFARVLGRLCEAAERAMSDNCLVVDYASLNLNTICRLTRFLGIPTASPESLARVIGIYSKDASRVRTFVDDSPIKRNQVTEAIRRAIDRYVSTSYTALRRQKAL